jgi:hypothetical protein
MGDLHLIRKRWPGLRASIATRKRLRIRFNMSAAVCALRSVGSATQHWHSLAKRRSRAHTLLSLHLHNKRVQCLRAVAQRWRRTTVHSTAAGRAGDKASLLWKRKMFACLMRRVLVGYDWRSIVDGKRGMRARPSNRKYILYCGMLFRKKHSLVRQWRHHTRILFKQRGALLWGKRW